MKPESRAIGNALLVQHRHFCMRDDGTIPMRDSCLILLWLVCAAVTFFGKYEGHYVGGSQKEAFDKFQHGERLSESDVADLASGPRRVSPEEERGATRVIFNCCTVVFGLPGLIIVLYLYFTRGG